MAYEKEVTKALKPKIASLGFSKEEVRSIAALVAGNLDLTEEATEEEVNEAVEKGINSVLPFLQVGQKMATRVVNATKSKNANNDDDDDVNDDDDDNADSGKSKSKKASKSDDTLSALEKSLSQLVEQNKALNARLDSIEAGKVSDGRKAKLEKLLKDTGTYGKRTLKNFSLMTFKDDDAFDEFYSEVEDDLKTLNQERVSAGLEKIGPPALGAKGGRKNDEPEKLSDEDVQAIADNM